MALIAVSIRYDAPNSMAQPQQLHDGCLHILASERLVVHGLGIVEPALIYVGEAETVDRREL